MDHRLETRAATAVRHRLESEPHVIVDVVRTATRRSDAVPVGWSVAEMAGGAGNPTSAGLFRISGHLDGDHETPPWSVVLKALRSPLEEPDPMDHPDHAFYWRREVEVYRSGLLDELPAGIVAPRCLGVIEHRDATAWLWLEDMGPVGRSEWGEPDCHLAAARLARLHAAYLTDRHVPDLPWLNRSFARAWHALTMLVIRDVLDRAVGGQDDYEPLDPASCDPRISTLLALMRDPEPFLAALESQPQTLCHLDANAHNMLVRVTSDGDPELVVIDWQLLGVGPIGEDLGQFLSVILPSQKPSQRAGWEERILVGYWQELVTAGVDIRLRDAWLGYCAAAAMRQVCFAFLLLGMNLASLDPLDGPAISSTVRAFADEAARGHLPGLVTRGRALLEG